MLRNRAKTFAHKKKNPEISEYTNLLFHYKYYFWSIGLDCLTTCVGKYTHIAWMQVGKTIF